MHERNTPCPRILTFRPPRIALSLLALAASLHVMAPAGWPSLPAAPLAGGLLALAGFCIMIRAWWLFRVVDTAICPTAESRALITRDVYRVTRNPMYLGMVLMLLGTAVGIGGSPFYLAALAFFLVIDYVFCPVEERQLTARFGERYLTYRREVRRWL